jgi:purine-binding chemotaxis protein CheW
VVDILKLRKLQKKSEEKPDAESRSPLPQEQPVKAAYDILETPVQERPKEEIKAPEPIIENTPEPEKAPEKPAEQPKGLSIKELLAKKKAEKEQAAAEKTATEQEASQKTEQPAVIIDDADFDEPGEEKTDPKIESILIDEKDFDEPETPSLKPEQSETKKTEAPAIPTETKLNRFADEKEDEGLEQIKLVTFKLSEQRFGIPIDSVQEVVKLIEITRVPNVAYYIIGVINLRGIITPVADLRKRLHLDETVLSKHSRIIVLTIDGQAIGFLVDAIADILTTEKNDIQPAPPLVSNIDSRYIMGVVDPRKEENYSEIEQLVIVLDLAQIFIPAEEAGENLYA